MNRNCSNSAQSTHFRYNMCCRRLVVKYTLLITSQHVHILSCVGLQICTWNHRRCCCWWLSCFSGRSVMPGSYPTHELLSNPRCQVRTQHTSYTGTRYQVNLAMPPPPNFQIWILPSSPAGRYGHVKQILTTFTIMLIYQSMAVLNVGKCVI